MANETWSQKPLITEISNTTEFCILDEAIPKNKRINAKTLLDTKANVSDLNNVDNTSDLNKPISAAQQTALDLKAPLHNPKFTGDATLNGEPISTNDLNGTNYVMVYGTGTPEENGLELQAAYNAAKTKPRYLEGAFSIADILGYTTFYKGQTLYQEQSNAYYRFLEDVTVASAYDFDNINSEWEEITKEEAKATRFNIIVAPGDYYFEGTFFINLSGVNIVSLTGNKDVNIKDGEVQVQTYSTHICGLKVDENRSFYVDNLFYGYTDYSIWDFDEDFIIENCEGGVASFGEDIPFRGKCINCVGGDVSFYTNEDSAPDCTFINCRNTYSNFPIVPGSRVINCINSDGSVVNYPQLSDLNGTNYLMVYGVGTPEENAAELQAAYNEAKKMPRFIGLKSTPTQMYAGQTFGTYTGSYKYYKVLVDGTYDPLNLPSSVELVGTESEAKSTRTTVIVAPGEYNFGASAFVVNESGINIVSLTGNSDVIISSTEVNSQYDYIYGIKVTANNILIKGINCRTNTFYIESYLNNIICEYCKGGNYSFGYSSTVSGIFNYCIGGNYSFGGRIIASGTFNNCTGGDKSFGYRGPASGTFNYCTGGNDSFGSNFGGTASGTFNNCTGGDYSFGTYGTALGKFNYCTGGDYSFGSYGGTISGTFNNCIGGGGSFEGSFTESARLYYTRLTSGSFRTPESGGRLILCIDGYNNIVTT